MAPVAPSTFWSQSLEFSCGPSALGSVLLALGWIPSQDRFAEELEIWRESTAVACPGTHPFGLALAAVRRGFAAEVRTVGPRPWLWRHIQRHHRSLGLREYRAVERSLARACRRAGVRLGTRAAPPRGDRAGLLLTRSADHARHRADPHWIGLVPTRGSVTVMDPLRRFGYRSDRTLQDWWEDSGFDGTKSWVELRPARSAGSGTPANPRPSDGREGTPHGDPRVHRPPHHLAGRSWTREEAISRLESPDRRRTQDPSVVWERAGLKAGETVVEVGAGTGFFAIEAARRVGPAGRVFAVDISSELVELLHERRATADLPQLTPVHSTPGSIPIASGVADLLLFANVLHDVPPATVDEAVRLLKPEGRAVNVDWKKRDTPGGPPFEIRLSPEQAAGRLKEHGLFVHERWELGPWHYGLTLRRTKPTSPPRSRRRP